MSGFLHKCRAEPLSKSWSDMGRTCDWLMLAAFSGLLLLVSLVPKEDLGSDLRELLEGRDKILHGIAYAVLAVRG